MKREMQKVTPQEDNNAASNSAAPAAVKKEVTLEKKEAPLSVDFTASSYNDLEDIKE